MCLLQDQWIGYVLVCCFGVVFTVITQGELDASNLLLLLWVRPCSKQYPLNLVWI